MIQMKKHKSLAENILEKHLNLSLYDNIRTKILYAFYKNKILNAMQEYKNECIKNGK